jgi:hypothetical protein
VKGITPSAESIPETRLWTLDEARRILVRPPAVCLPPHP